jgi:molybdenum cofactor cytidylyltransferase
VVGPPHDAPGAAVLVAEARAAGALVVQPAAPTADMRASIERGLEPLRAGPEPEAVLIAPGDCPGLDPAVVARLIAAARGPHPGAIVVPACDGRRGHPVLIPWPLAATIPGLPQGLGVNALLAQHPDRLIELECSDPRVLADLDSPDDYRRWAHAFGPEGGGPAD